MSFRDCILRAKQQGLLDDQKQLDLTNEYDANYDRYIKDKIDPEIAAKQAGLDTFNQMKVDASQKIKERKQTIKLQQRYEFNLNRYIEQSGKTDYGSVMKQTLIFTENKQGVYRVRSTEEEMVVVQGRLDSIYSEVLKKFRHNLLGSSGNKATMVLVGREIFNPGSTGNKAAEELARAWIETSETARRMFNAAGGRIPKMKDGKWHLPQVHQELLVRGDGSTAARNAWKEFVLERLDLEEMIDYKTGRKMGIEELNLALDDVWETISTAGFSKKSNVKKYNSKLSGRRLDHRFLKFKDFDAWDSYNKKYGKGNMFDSMVGHIKNMSKDIAIMRTLSPDPDQFISWMKFATEKKLRTETPSSKITVNGITLEKKLTEKQLFKKLNKLKSDFSKVDEAYRALNGDMADPENYTFAKYSSGLRDLTTSMYLGAASFMALGDFNLTRITAKVHGLPAAKTMYSNLKLFSQGFRQDKSTLVKVAASSGMVAEHWGTIASGMARVSSDDIERPEVTKRFADFVLRTTGLSWLTQAGRWGVGMETMAFFARNASLSWDELGKKNSKFRELLKTNNIDSGDWEIIRKVPIYDAGVDDTLNKGAEFLRPSDIFKLTDIDEEKAMDVFAKFQATINYVVDFAVPNSKLRGTLLGGAKPGTIMGETMKNILQFKQFPLAFMFGHIARGMGLKGGWRKAAYLTDLLVSTTLFGAFAFEMKKLTKGEKPTDLSSMDAGQKTGYLLGNMIRGGGLGIAGDLLFATQYGGKEAVAASIIGSVPMLAIQIGDITAGNAFRAAQGEDVNLGGDLANFVKRNTPGGSIWYLRLALERYIFDNLQQMLDPKYHQKRKRLIKRKRKEQGTEFWWSPGDKLPKEYPF